MKDMDRAMILDGIRTEKELCAIIVKIVDAIIKEQSDAIRDVEKWQDIPGNDLEKFAKIAELKIRIQEVKRINTMVCKILKTSQNKMILATIQISN